MKTVIAVLCMAALARSQIPSLGFCPEYLPMVGFDMERFSGIWYEAERYFQLSEVASRCVKSNYTRGPDGKFRVLNEVTSIFTGIKRVVEGEIRKAPSKAEEGRLHVKYTSVPLIPLETQYNVLETDYKNYAVLWSCSGVGPVNTQNAWIMTRQRNAPGEILQRAYAVLDKYKISKLFFMKTNQEDCAYLDSLDADQNIRPPAEAAPIKTDSAESSEEYNYNVPQPLKAAEPIQEEKSVVPEAVVNAANKVQQQTAEIINNVKEQANKNFNNAQETVVNAVKNAASAVKKAAEAIKNAAIKQPVVAAEPQKIEPSVQPAHEVEAVVAEVAAAAAADLAPAPAAETVKTVPEKIAEKSAEIKSKAQDGPSPQVEAEKIETPVAEAVRSQDAPVPSIEDKKITAPVSPVLRSQDAPVSPVEAKVQQNEEAKVQQKEETKNV